MKKVQESREGNEHAKISPSVPILTMIRCASGTGKRDYQNDPGQLEGKLRSSHRGRPIERSDSTTMVSFFFVIIVVLVQGEVAGIFTITNCKIQ